MRRHLLKQFGQAIRPSSYISYQRFPGWWSESQSRHSKTYNSFITGQCREYASWKCRIAVQSVYIVRGIVGVCTQVQMLHDQDCAVLAVAMNSVMLHPLYRQRQRGLHKGPKIRLVQRMLANASECITVQLTSRSNAHGTHDLWLATQPPRKSSRDHKDHSLWLTSGPFT